MKKVNGKVLFDSEHPQVVKGKAIMLSGPYYKVSHPFGVAVESTARHEWFVSRDLTPEELADPNTSEIRKLLKSVSLGHITNFLSQPKRFVIDQLFPIKEFKSLKRAIEFLVENEGKLVFCS
jgi:hypothetical protein